MGSESKTFLVLNFFVCFHTRGLKHKTHSPKILKVGLKLLFEITFQTHYRRLLSLLSEIMEIETDSWAFKDAPKVKKQSGSGPKKLKEKL